MAYITAKDIDGSHAFSIRFARTDDLDALTSLYNHYVLNTAVTFDTIPFTSQERQGWFSQFEANQVHQCLVVCVDGSIKGYATSARLRPKPAYDSSVEATIYLDPDEVGKGLGVALYQTLLDNLTGLGVHRCYGIIALPNVSSIGLHKKLGFKQVGLLHEVGHKFGRFHDTAWYEKSLAGD